MKNSFSLSKTALAVACGSLLALSAQAQSANDSATVDITGQISASTCVLNMKDAKSGTSTNEKTLNLGNAKSGTSNNTIGGTFGEAQKVEFSLGTYGNSATTCVAGTGNNRWNVILGFAPGNVITTNGKTYVKNQDAAGTDAMVVLSDATTATTTPLTLKETLGYAGTTATASNVLFADKITLQAQLAYAATTEAKAGAFTASIPLLVLYK